MALPEGTLQDDGEAEPPFRLRAPDAAAAALGLLVVAMLLPPLQALFSGAFWLLAVVVVRSDLDRYLIPDAASLGVAALGLAQAWQTGGEADAAAALAHGAGAGMAVYAVRTGYRWLRGQEGIGFGDVKLAAALGLWLDPFAQALALQLAAMAALGVVLVGGAIRRRAGAKAETQAEVEVAHGLTMVPFGAFLAPAGFAVHVWSLAVPDGWGAWP